MRLLLPNWVLPAHSVSDRNVLPCEFHPGQCPSDLQLCWQPPKALVAPQYPGITRLRLPCPQQHSSRPRWHQRLPHHRRRLPPRYHHADADHVHPDADHADTDHRNARAAAYVHSANFFKTLHNIVRSLCRYTSVYYPEGCQTIPKLLQSIIGINELINTYYRPSNR